MNSSTVIEVLGLAAADSVNPPTIASVANAALTHRTAAPAAAFAGAQAVLNAGVGCAIVAGLGSLEGEVEDSRVLASVTLGLGALVVAAAIVGLARASKPREPPRLLPARPVGVLPVAAVVYALTLPFAGQFFLAMSKVADDAGPTGAQVALVAAYAAVFTAPLWALVALRRWRGWPRAMRWASVAGDLVLLLAGILLVATAASRL